MTLYNLPPKQQEETGLYRLGNALKSLGDSLSSINMLQDDSDDEESILEEDRAMIVDSRYNKVVQVWKKKFAYGSNDVEVFAEQPSFENLKRTLRKDGYVTNTYLQQNLHHYLYRMKCKDDWRLKQSS